MLLVSKINVPTESEECVVEGLALVYGVVHPSHRFSMPHTTLLKQCADNNPYRYLCPWTTMLLLLRGMVNAIGFKITGPPESEECVVEYVSMVYGVIHPCQTLSLPHIILQKE